MLPDKFSQLLEGKEILDYGIGISKDILRVLINIV